MAYKTTSPHSTKHVVRTLPHESRGRLGGHLHFLSEYLRNPKQIGAIAPSSEYLAQAMTLPEWFDSAKTIVELGPGNGSVTAAIEKKLHRKKGTFFAIEINPSMCEKLRARFPKTNIYCDSAGEIQKYLSKHKAQHADCIISSIPWAAFSLELQEELMTAIVKNLRPGGWFITFTYITSPVLPSGRLFRKVLDRFFDQVSASPVVWRNIPPAFVYRCRKI